jgi:hypothetical protein
MRRGEGGKGFTAVTNEPFNRVEIGRWDRERKRVSSTTIEERERERKREKERERR